MARRSNGLRNRQLETRKAGRRTRTSHAHVVDECEPHLRFEEELRQAEVGDRELLGLPPAIVDAVGGRGMGLRVRTAYPKRAGTEACL